MSDTSPEFVSWIHIEARPGPIACDFAGATDTPEERLREWGLLFARALVGRERIEEAVQFSFRRLPGVAEWIGDLVRREAACCPFLGFDVELADDQIEWTLRSSRMEAQPSLDEIFATAAPGGSEALLARYLAGDPLLVDSAG